MTKEYYIQVLQQQQSITKSQIAELSSLLEKYPYFQSARALYLKGLKSKESFKYNSALKLTAAYTTDRSILFDYITSDIFNQNEVTLQIKQNTEYLKNLTVNDLDDISVSKSMAIDYALKQQISDTEGVLDPDLFEKKATEEVITTTTSTNTIAVDVDNIIESPEEKLSIGKPLNFNKSETHSFSEWLKITSFKPIQREETKEKNPAPIESKLELIDKFISENPKIKPLSEERPKPKIKPIENSPQDSLMTETLARIYLEQKNYKKAIQSYKILSLKYPEKSGFFADQIKAVKELQDKNNIE